ncbi:sialic acid-binding Ig-like lectin 12 isoform X2 [Synchiropus splendidus]|uniref:sialic acid-binding Ig-like lectin 12 isoform X2 n=1 Tax=Synchiropus splendidus TaxID=270530 RepID=UPI00237EA2B6|nr:sialic acid-binding Ig-like lectin 12 isoform X2 [Synchiropus splendidus]XP_053700139.1 sialic acid-binding Ig-like lectin 12 isoform X2 [Synchiropus splendidus]
MKSVVMIILTSALVQAGLKETCTDGDFCVTLDDGVITAESGLCVEIPCSFKTPQSFTPQHMLWFRCEQRHERCDLIYSTDSSAAIRKGFEGQVSLLESDVSQRNCSIIINDLSLSDSGWYQLRLTSKDNGYTYGTKQEISVRGLRQKPILDVPQLKEGQLTALTCTAPGLCSGSEPTISWKWEGKGKSPHLVGGNITAQKSVSLGAVRRQYSSTLIFSASSEHHSSSITCTVVFKHGGSTEEKQTLEVQWFAGILSGSRCERDSAALTCVCGSQGHPLPSISWPLLTDHSDSHIQTNVSGDEIWSSFSVKDGHSVKTVVCVVTHENGETKQELLVLNHESSLTKFLKLEFLIAFLTRIVLSAVIFFLFHQYFSKKEFGRPEETAEMANMADDPQTDDGYQPVDIELEE